MKARAKKRKAAAVDVKAFESQGASGGASGDTKLRGKYRLSSMVRGDTGANLYCVAINTVSPNHADVFATVGANRATLYRCSPEGGMHLIQCYVDENADEGYFACTWCKARGSSNALLAVAGLTGVIRIIDVTAEAIFRNLRGHGNSVNDVRAHPCAPHLLLSASRDESCRLWNVDNGLCLAVFSGALGHRNEVLTVDFKVLDPHTEDLMFVSGAMDNMVKVWSMSGYRHLVGQSETWNKAIDTFPTAHIQTPVFSSFRVHANYVDCVRWFGDLILSKSVERSICLWQPEIGVGKGDSFRKVHDYAVKDADIWFIRFALDASCNTMVCGNRTGDLFVWRMHSRAPVLLGALSDKGCKKAVRQTAISADGEMALAVCDDGTVWRWDFNEYKEFAFGGVGKSHYKGAKTVAESLGGLKKTVVTAVAVEAAAKVIEQPANLVAFPEGVVKEKAACVGSADVRMADGGAIVDDAAGDVAAAATETAASATATTKAVAAAAAAVAVAVAEKEAVAMAIVVEKEVTAAAAAVGPVAGQAAPPAAAPPASAALVAATLESESVAAPATLQSAVAAAGAAAEAAAVVAKRMPQQAEVATGERKAARVATKTVPVTIVDVTRAFDAVKAAAIACVAAGASDSTSESRYVHALQRLTVMQVTLALFTEGAMAVVVAGIKQIRKDKGATERVRDAAKACIRAWKKLYIPDDTYISKESIDNPSKETAGVHDRPKQESGGGSGSGVVGGGGGLPLVDDPSDGPSWRTFLGS